MLRTSLNGRVRLGMLGLEPAFPSEEPCMAVTCTNPLSLVLNSYLQGAR